MSFEEVAMSEAMFRHDGAQGSRAARGLSLPLGEISSDALLRCDPQSTLSLERAELVTEAYRSSHGEPWIIRRARALEAVLHSIPIDVDESSRLVGCHHVDPRAVHLFPEVTTSSLQRSMKQGVSSEERLRVAELVSAWRGRSFAELAARQLNLDGEVMSQPELAVSLGITCPDYRRALRLGMTGIISETRHFRCVLSANDEDFEERRDYLEAVRIVARALVDFAGRHGATARARIAGESPGDRRLRDLAELCDRVPLLPPATFHEALQLVHLVYIVTATLEGSLIPPPRLDVLLEPFYTRELYRGEIDYSGAVELLEDHVRVLAAPGFAETIGSLKPEQPWSLPPMIVVGGRQAENQDVEATAELTEAVLEAVERAGSPTLVVAMRIHDELAPAHLSRALRISAQGRATLRFDLDGAVEPWISRALLKHLEPREAKNLALGKLELVDAVRRTSSIPAVRRLSREGARLLAGESTRRATRALASVPYALGAGDSTVWRGLRVAFDQTTLLNTNRLVRVARQWTPSASILPSIPGLSVKGGLSPNSLETTLDLEAALLSALRSFGSEHSVLSSSDRATQASPLKIVQGDAERGSLAALFRRFEQVIEERVRGAMERWAAVEDLATERLPRPLASCLTGGCNRRARDATSRAEASLHAVRVVGLERAARHLRVIRVQVFESRRRSCLEIANALMEGFEGYEDVEKLLAESREAPPERRDVMALVEATRRAAGSVRDRKNRPTQAAFVDGWGTETTSLRLDCELDDPQCDGLGVGPLVAQLAHFGEREHHTVYLKAHNDGPITEARLIASPNPIELHTLHS